MAKANTSKRPAAKNTGKSKPAFIRAISPPSEILPYDDGVMAALGERWDKENARIQSERVQLQRQLYRQVFSWWESEIRNAKPCDDGWETRLQIIYDRADREWTELSGLPPLVRWNGLDWRRAAKLAEYSGDNPQAIVDGLVVRFTSPAKKHADPWSKADGPKQWAKKLGFSVDTLMRRFKENKIRHLKLSSKSYRIHVDDLPK